MASAALSPAARSPTWLACRGDVRPVADGEVICPIAGKAIPLGSCPTCRWLEDADDDRRTAWTCSAEPASGRRPDLPAAAADGDLMIELL